ncbi:hypothetical protein FNF31_00535 [Cafeteria roenbergensis]|uniref:C2 domain-containing protein n=1 Tax=Cafeteria roenbergensis TaxID=33653 RepID=A0A5A8DRH1_CAFRO|nr:hypothetical protein FNF31_00535 [Cafeteria roenbergensis]
MNRGKPFVSRLLEEREIERRRDIHRAKRDHVRNLGIDNETPAMYPHVVTNAKRRMAQRERMMEVERENRLLLMRMARIADRGKSAAASREYSAGVRLDAAQTPMLDNFVAAGTTARGAAVPKASMNYSVRRKEAQRIARENLRLLDRIVHTRSVLSAEEMDREAKQQRVYAENLARTTRAPPGDGIRPRSPGRRGAAARPRRPRGTGRPSTSAGGRHRRLVDDERGDRPSSSGVGTDGGAMWRGDGDELPPIDRAAAASAEVEAARARAAAEEEARRRAFEDAERRRAQEQQAAREQAEAEHQAQLRAQEEARQRRIEEQAARAERDARRRAEEEAARAAEEAERAAEEARRAAEEEAARRKASAEAAEQLAGKGTLLVHLVRAKSLPSGDTTGAADAYVVAQCGQAKATSARVDNSADPVWDEVLSLPLEQVGAEEGDETSLVLTVTDYDRFSRDDALGSAVLPLRRDLRSEHHGEWSESEVAVKAADGSDTGGKVVVRVAYVRDAPYGAGAAEDLSAEFGSPASGGGAAASSGAGGGGGGVAGPDASAADARARLEAEADAKGPPPRDAKTGDEYADDFEDPKAASHAGTVHVSGLRLVNVPKEGWLGGKADPYLILKAASASKQTDVAAGMAWPGLVGAVCFTLEGEDAPEEPEFGRDGQVSTPAQVLRVVVEGASDLPSEGGFMGGKQDAFAVVSLAGSGDCPTLSQRVQTKVVSGSNDPEWGETFELYTARPGEVETGVVVELMDKDSMSAADPIGRAVIALDDDMLARARAGEGEGEVLTASLVNTAAGKEGQPLAGAEGKPSTVRVRVALVQADVAGSDLSKQAREAAEAQRRAEEEAAEAQRIADAGKSAAERAAEEEAARRKASAEAAEQLAGKGTLLVHLVRAKSLPSGDTTGAADAYVVAQCGQAKATSVRVDNSADPVWDEVLSLPLEQVGAEEGDETSLVLTVTDYDRFSRDDALGSAVLPLRRDLRSEHHGEWSESEVAVKAADGSDTGGKVVVRVAYVRDAPYGAGAAEDLSAEFGSPASGGGAAASSGAGGGGGGVAGPDASAADARARLEAEADAKGPPPRDAKAEAAPAAEDPKAASHAGTVHVSGLRLVNVPKEGWLGGKADPYLILKAASASKQTDVAAGMAWPGVTQLPVSGAGPRAVADGVESPAHCVWVEAKDSNVLTADRAIGVAALPLTDDVLSDEGRGQWHWHTVALRSEGQGVAGDAGSSAQLVGAVCFTLEGEDAPEEPEFGRDGQVSTPAQVLRVVVEGASDLPSEGGFMGGKQDAFAVVSLAGSGDCPTLSQRVQTKVVSGSNDPEWGETFELYTARPGEVETGVVVELMDKDSMSAADPIGRAVIALDDDMLARARAGEGEGEVLTASLVNTAAGKEGQPLKGDKGASSTVRVRVALVQADVAGSDLSKQAREAAEAQRRAEEEAAEAQRIADAGKSAAERAAEEEAARRKASAEAAEQLAGKGTLLVHLVRAKSLPSGDTTGAADAYVVAQCGQAKATSVRVDNSADPVWDEVLSLPLEQVGAEEGDETSLVLTVTDYDRFSRDDALGSAVLPLRRDLRSEHHGEWSESEVAVKAADGSDTGGKVVVRVAYVRDAPYGAGAAEDLSAEFGSPASGGGAAASSGAGGGGGGVAGPDASAADARARLEAEADAKGPPPRDAKAEAAPAAEDPKAASHAGTVHVSGLRLVNVPKEGWLGGKADPYLILKAGQSSSRTGGASGKTSVRWAGVAQLRVSGAGPRAVADGVESPAHCVWVEAKDSNVLTADRAIGVAALPLTDDVLSDEGRGQWHWHTVALRSKGRGVAGSKVGSDDDVAVAPAQLVGAVCFTLEGEDAPEEPEFGRDGQVSTPAQVLRVVVEGASDLPSEGGFMGGKQDAFAVVSLAGSGDCPTLSQRVQTKVVSGSNDPEWGETFELYTARPGEVETGVVVELMDKDSMSAADPIGRAVIALDDDMLARARAGEGEGEVLTASLVNTAAGKEGQPLKGDKGASSTVRVRVALVQADSTGTSLSTVAGKTKKAAPAQAAAAASVKTDSPAASAAASAAVPVERAPEEAVAAAAPSKAFKGTLFVSGLQVDGIPKEGWFGGAADPYVCLTAGSATAKTGAAADASTVRWAGVGKLKLKGLGDAAVAAGVEGAARQVWVEVLDKNRFTKDKPVGSACVPLFDDMASSECRGKWFWYESALRLNGRPVVVGKGAKAMAARVRFAVAFCRKGEEAPEEPELGRDGSPGRELSALRVVVEGASDLPSEGGFMGGKQDAFAVVSLAGSGDCPTLSQRVQTKVVSGSNDPEWGETFELYTARPGEVETGVVVELMDKDSMSAADPIGRAVIALDDDMLATLKAGEPKALVLDLQDRRDGKPEGDTLKGNKGALSKLRVSLQMTPA